MLNRSLPPPIYYGSDHAYFIAETFWSSEVDEIARGALLVSLEFFFKEILDLV